MDYRKLTRIHRKKMKNSINESIPIMPWADDEIFTVLQGKIPPIKGYSHANEDEINKINCLLNSYDYFNTGRESFIAKLNTLKNEMNSEAPHYRDIAHININRYIDMHEFCILTGEGGIGKSYFMWKLEQYYEEHSIPHLCIYGKQLRNVEYDCFFDTIHSGSIQILMVDAFNELSPSIQLQLISALEKPRTGQLRIIITYRTGSLHDDTQQKLHSIAKSIYYFPGVEYNSTFSSLIELGISDLYRYIDLIYTSNPLHLTMLNEILSGKGEQRRFNNSLNNISSLTDIYEQYIRNSCAKIVRTQRELLQTDIDASRVWSITKTIASKMFDEEKKYLTSTELAEIESDAKMQSDYYLIMKQAGLAIVPDNDLSSDFYFTYDSLADYLIARSFLNLLESKADRLAALKKINAIPGLVEPLLLIVFDKYSPNFQKIYDLLIEMNILECLTLNAFKRIHFKEEWIPIFQSSPLKRALDAQTSILYSAGFVGNPYNCVNYLTKYYLSNLKNQNNLSRILEHHNEYFDVNLLYRLKGAIFYISKRGNSTEQSVLNEYLWFAVWCCSSPDISCRYSAMKLLFEVLHVAPQYAKTIIQFYDEIYDPYIKESIICVLAASPRGNGLLIDFFHHLIESEELTARSIYVISDYLGARYSYIHWERANVMDNNSQNTVSKELNDLLFKISIYDTVGKPFKYNWKNDITFFYNFLSNDKKEIASVNGILKDIFSCVQHGDCHGSYSEKELLRISNLQINKEKLNDHDIVIAFQNILSRVFTTYDISYSEIDTLTERNYSRSSLMKFFEISSGLLMGSLICNYYLDEFSTYNNDENSIGYSICIPLFPDEEYNMTMPVTSYNYRISELHNVLISRLSPPSDTYTTWVSDKVLSEKNLLSLLKPVDLNGETWILLAGTFQLQERNNYTIIWQDKYFVRPCTTTDICLEDNGYEQSLTIDLLPYSDNLYDYTNLTSNCHLCMEGRNQSTVTGLYDNGIILPPASMLEFFNLSLDFSNSTWTNPSGEIIMMFSNTEDDYYTTPVTETLFIKEQYLSVFLRQFHLKYFCFTEKFINSQSFIPDRVSYHYEVDDNTIIREISNLAKSRRDIDRKCDCPYGLNKTDSAFEQYEKLIGELGYISMDENDD